MQTPKSAKLAGLFTDYIWTEVYFTTKLTSSIYLHDSKLNKSTIFIQKEVHLMKDVECEIYKGLREISSFCLPEF